jgi:hypothetical protein
MSFNMSFNSVFNIMFGQSAVLLFMFLEKIRDYEPALFDYILEIHNYSKSYEFKSNTEFKYGIDIWFYNKKIAIEKYGHISRWNTINITNMDYLFFDRIEFNENITEWDVSNVREMNLMFYNTKKFNRNIGKWNIKNVTMAYQIFAYNYVLDRDYLKHWHIFGKYI